MNAQLRARSTVLQQKAIAILAHHKRGDKVMRDQLMTEFLGEVLYYPQRATISTKEYRGEAVEVRYWTPKSSTHKKCTAVTKWAQACVID